MYALAPVVLIALIALYFFSRRKDKKTKTRLAWMLLISCSAIIVAANEFLGKEEAVEGLWPFGSVAAVSLVWLIALKTQKD